MTLFHPSTCACQIIFPDKPYDESKGRFVQQCRAHDTVSQTLTHNRRFGNSPDDQETERKKPVHQRR